MIGRLAYAHGSPSPTLVLDSRLLPKETDELVAVLAEARQWLRGFGGGHVLKIALIEPSSHPLFDLDYRFVQALPDDDSHFDLRGSCGHSILASVVSASDAGMLPRLAPRDRVRVNVVNNGDNVVCEVERLEQSRARFTVHFLRTPPDPIRSMLPTGDAFTTLDIGGRPLTVSFVSVGNPYVFVDAASIGVTTTEELFADDPELFATLSGIRTKAAVHLGWDPNGAFPKVAALLPASGGVAVRAVSVPSWHPTLALTGAVCLGAACHIPGTVTASIAARAGYTSGLLDIHTAGGMTAVSAVVAGPPGDERLHWVTVGRKEVELYGSFVVQPLSHLQFPEVSACLPLPA